MTTSIEIWIELVRWLRHLIWAFLWIKGLCGFPQDQLENLKDQYPKKREIKKTELPLVVMIKALNQQRKGIKRKAVERVGRKDQLRSQNKDWGS